MMLLQQHSREAFSVPHEQVVIIGMVPVLCRTGRFRRRQWIQRLWLRLRLMMLILMRQYAGGSRFALRVEEALTFRREAPAGGVSGGDGGSSGHRRRWQHWLWSRSFQANGVLDLTRSFEPENVLTNLVLVHSPGFDDTTTARSRMIPLLLLLLLLFDHVRVHFLPVLFLQGPTHRLVPGPFDGVQCLEKDNDGQHHDDEQQP
jgi:hypothetical protein